jgi:vanillate O-demethylase monooxygenase subunit
LSLGRVVGGELVCGYHGLRMGGAGRPVSMPNQRVSSFPCVRAYPSIERHGFVWVWLGDAAAADPALLPVVPWDGQSGWAYGGGLYRIDCDYRLMIDNLMDLTHETYVHADSIGQPDIDETPAATEVEGQQVVTSRFMHGISAPPFWQAALREVGLPDEQPVDRWQVCRFTPPSNVMIEVGVALAGKGGIVAPDADKVYGVVVDFITPETEHSIWYFWGMARRFGAGDAALTDRIREGQGRIFSEDREMLERQQRNLLRWPERRLLKLNIDSGGVRARLMIDRLLAAEREAARAAAPPVGTTS